MGYTKRIEGKGGGGDIWNTKSCQEPKAKRKIQMCQLHDKQVTVAVRSWTLFVGGRRLKTYMEYLLFCIFKDSVNGSDVKPRRN